MKRRLCAFATSAALIAICTSKDASATLYLGWADEFLGGLVDCNTDVGSCTVVNRNGGPYQMPPLEDGTQTYWGEVPPTWQYVGAQGGTTAGRQAAKEKVMFRFRENSPDYGVSVTVQLSRFRFSAPPPDGTACSSTNGVYIGSVSQTISSTQWASSVTYFNNRMLPVFDFSAETATGGTTLGYHTNLTVTASSGMGGVTAVEPGCYRIKWN